MSDFFNGCCDNCQAQSQHLPPAIQEGIDDMASGTTDRLKVGGMDAFEDNLRQQEEELGVEFTDAVEQKLKYETALAIAEDGNKTLLYVFENETSRYLWPNGDIVDPHPVNPSCEDIEGGAEVLDFTLQEICELADLQ